MACSGKNSGCGCRGCMGWDDHSGGGGGCGSSAQARSAPRAGSGARRKVPWMAVVARRSQKGRAPALGFVHGRTLRGLRQKVADIKDWIEWGGGGTPAHGPFFGGSPGGGVEDCGRGGSSTAGLVGAQYAWRHTQSWNEKGTQSDPSECPPVTVAPSQGRTGRCKPRHDYSEYGDVASWVTVQEIVVKSRDGYCSKGIERHPCELTVVYKVESKKKQRKKYGFAGA